MNAHTIVDTKPAGYRWATEVECDRQNHPAYFSKMVQVRVTIAGYESESFTDLAIQDGDAEGGATVIAFPKRPSPSLLTTV